MKNFVTWEFNGVKFLAGFNAGDYVICDEKDNFYGAYSSVEFFRAEQAKKSDISKPIAKVSSVRIISKVD